MGTLLLSVRLRNKNELNLQFWQTQSISTAFYESANNEKEALKDYCVTITYVVDCVLSSDEDFVHHSK